MLINALNFFTLIKIKIVKEISENKIISEILDILFPPVCGICGKFNKNWICKNCYKSIRRLKIYRYLKERQKKILLKDVEKFFKIKLKNFIKNQKIKEEVFYEEFFYLFQYKGIIRRIILRYKFQNQAYLSNLFAKLILKDKTCCRKIKQYDIMIPVPMFEKKKKQRGYNQTELIAKQICENVRIKLDTTNLIKIKNTKIQSTLSKSERKENIKGAFLVNNKHKIANKKIIIFDDIFTTGETVNEISKILKQAGAKEILVFVLARD